MTESDVLSHTPLHALHLEMGAKMVPFAGYLMPVQYTAGIIKEHLHTRNAAGLFDVSHMGQLQIWGEGRCSALEKLLPADLQSLGVNQQKYSLLTNELGGIRDDLMILNRGGHLHVVVNAACKNTDLDYLNAQIGKDVELRLLEDKALLALQGPQAVEVLRQLAPGCESLTFMQAGEFDVEGMSCLITRSGYTGEDGYEISMAADHAPALARRLLSFSEVQAIGLGARDSLRLEAGLCLYGHDIDQTTTPVEAALNWVIPKVRRLGGEREGGFPGAGIILQQLKDGVTRKRVGLKPEGRAPIREGVELLNEQGETVGRVCSGGFGPSVGGPVAMGYVATERADHGTNLTAIVRGKPQAVTVCKPLFVQQRYYRG